MLNFKLCRSSIRTAVAVAGAASLYALSSSSNNNVAYNDAEANSRLSRQPTFNATTTKHSLKMFKRSIATKQNMVVISGSAHRALSEEICAILNVPLADAKMARFSDGEVNVVLNEQVRGKHVFIVQPCAAPVGDSIMELLLAISCARRAGASKISAVIPYFGYKHHRRGSSISQKELHSRFLTSGAMDFAKMLEVVGVDTVLAVDLQRPGQGHEACFFDTTIPLETVVTTSTFVEYFTEREPLSEPIMVVAPAPENVKKAKRLQRGLQKHFQTAVGLGVRLDPLDAGEEMKLEVLGSSNVDLSEFKGADVVIVNELIEAEGGKISGLCDLLTKAGAKSIYVCASHGLFDEALVKEIDESPAITRCVVTNSLPLPPGCSSPKVQQVSIAPLLAQLILAELFGSNPEDLYLLQTIEDDEN